MKTKCLWFVKLGVFHFVQYCAEDHFVDFVDDFFFDFGTLVVHYFAEDQNSSNKMLFKWFFISCITEGARFYRKEDLETVREKWLETRFQRIEVNVLYGAVFVCLSIQPTSMCTSISPSTH